MLTYDDTGSQDKQEKQKKRLILSISVIIEGYLLSIVHGRKVQKRIEEEIQQERKAS